MFDTLHPNAEKLVRSSILGTRKGMPMESNYLHSYRVRDVIMKYHHWDDGDCDLFLAALLHDIFEDGGVSIEELKRMGYADRTIELIELCTHPMDVEDETARWVLMIAKLIEAHDEAAWSIKMCDLADNLSQSSGLDPLARTFMIEVKAPLMLRLTEGFVFCPGYRGCDQRT